MDLTPEFLEAEVPLPEGYSWVMFAQDPAIKLNKTGMYWGWINTKDGDEPFSTQLIAHPAVLYEKEEVTPLDLCKILAATLWVGA